MKQKPKTLLRAWDAAQLAEPGITPRVFALRQGFSDNGKHTAEDVLMVRLETARREQEIAGKYHFSLGQPLALQGDYMLVGDPHAPFIDYQWAERVAAVATKRLKAPRRLIVGGDFVNGDKWSSYPHIIEPPTWANERDALRGLVDYWLSTFAESAAADVLQAASGYSTDNCCSIACRACSLTVVPFHLATTFNLSSCSAVMRTFNTSLLVSISAPFVICLQCTTGMYHVSSASSCTFVAYAAGNVGRCVLL